MEFGVGILGLVAAAVLIWLFYKTIVWSKWILMAALGAFVGFIINQSIWGVLIGIAGGILVAFLLGLFPRIRFAMDSVATFCIGSLSFYLALMIFNSSVEKPLSPTFVFVLKLLGLLLPVIAVFLRKNYVAHDVTVTEHKNIFTDMEVEYTEKETYELDLNDQMSVSTGKVGTVIQRIIASIIYSLMYPIYINRALWEEMPWWLFLLLIPVFGIAYYFVDKYLLNSFFESYTNKKD